MNIFLSNADEKNSDPSNIESMNSQKIISLLDKTSPDENEQKNEQKKENENQNINQSNNDCGKKIIKLIFFLLLILINIFSYYYKANSHHNDWTKNKTDATDDELINGEENKNENKKNITYSKYGLNLDKEIDFNEPLIKQDSPLISDFEKILFSQKTV